MSGIVGRVVVGRDLGDLGDISDVDFSTPATEGQGIILSSGLWVPSYVAKPRGLNSNTLGWKDLIGDISPKSSGTGRPTLDTFRDDVRWFRYAVGDDGDIVFHLPHDYALGTDIFVHAHWTHNGTNISGNLDIRLHVTYSKGHGQEIYPADKEPHIVVSGLNITNTPQYFHRVDEVQLSTPGGSATLLDTNRLEPDGQIMMHYDFDVIPSITGGGGQPFLTAIDIHYQTDCAATLNKSPNFYQ